MQTRDIIDALQTVPAAVKAGIWDGLQDDKEEKLSEFSARTAFGAAMVLLTPIHPFAAALITCIGLKRITHGAYYVGSTLYSKCHHTENKEEEIEQVKEITQTPLMK